MDEKEMMLLKWKLKLLEDRPEILPEFEMDEKKKEIRLYCWNWLDGVDALEFFPEESGYSLKIFVGKNKKLMYPPPRKR